MSGILILSIVELILGVLINVFNGKTAKIVFNNDKGMSKVITRVVAIFLVIDPLLRIFK